MKTQLGLICCILCSVYQNEASTAKTCGEKVDSGWIWHVLIIDALPVRQSVLCGGTLLNKLFVVTAAHCLYNLNGDPINLEQLWILLGDGEQRSIRNTYHPKPFDVETLENDLVLIMMSQGVAFNKLVGPVCLTIGNEVHWKHIVVPVSTTETLVVNDEDTCRNNTVTLFQIYFEGALCLGSFHVTHKYHHTGGTGLLMNSNGTWYLVGILMYTTGPTEDQISYAGAVQVQKYATWIERILKYHSGSGLAISETKCKEYMRQVDQLGNSSVFHQTMVNLISSVSSRTICHGTIISPRFVLTTARCAQKTKRIFIPYEERGDSEWFHNLKFHFEEWDRKLALIELDRDVSPALVSCMHFKRDTETYNFTTRIIHPNSFTQIEDIQVFAVKSSPLHVRYLCSRFLYPGQFAIAGDALTIHIQGETLYRLVGLLDHELRCESWDYFYERPKRVEAINMVKYLPWIENIVWA